MTPENEQELEAVEEGKEEGAGKEQCPWCGAIFENKQALGGHMGKCPKRKEQREEPVKEEEVEEKEVRTLTRRPRTVEEILKEVLSDMWGLKPAFVNYVIRKSRQVGGLHPLELFNLLVKLDSGVRTKEEAQIVVDDYYTALVDAQREAQALGVRVVYPLGTRAAAPSEPAAGGFYGMGLFRRDEVGGYPPAAPPYVAQPPSPGMPYQPPVWPVERPRRGEPEERAESLTKEEVAEIINKILKEREEEQKKRALEEEVRSLKESLPQMIQEAVSKVASMVQPGITREEVEQILAQKEKDAYLKYLEESQKSYREFLEKSIQQFEEERKRHEAEKKELLEKFEEVKKVPPPSTEGYQRDEIRLLADTLHVLAQKNVVREIGRVVVEFAKPQGEAPPILEKVPGGKGVESYLPPELVEG